MNFMKIEKKVKNKLNRNSFFYKIVRFVFWKIKFLQNKIFGTKVQENYWKKHRSENDDWSNNNDWIEGYWKSRNHPHRQILIEKISKYSPLSVLEIGANCGPNLYLLAKKYPNIEIVGIDINEEAIKRGNEKFKREHIDNVKIFMKKADELEEFDNKKFDVIFTDATLLYVGPDKIEKVITGMLRLAKKGIVLLEHHSEKENKLGSYNKGNWIRNYKKLFASFGFEIKITKISPETWGGDWGKIGNIIEVSL